MSRIQNRKTTDDYDNQYSSLYKKFNLSRIPRKKIEGECWRPQANAFQKTKIKFRQNFTVGKHIKEFKLKCPES